MEKELTIGELFERGYVTATQVEEDATKQIRSYLTKTMQDKAPSNYRISVISGINVYLEFRLTNVRPDVKPGKTYTEVVDITVSITDYRTEDLEDLSVDLGKVVKQFETHKTLSYVTAKRLERDYRAKLDVRQPELEVKGVLK